MQQATGSARIVQLLFLFETRRIDRPLTISALARLYRSDRIGRDDYRSALAMVVGRRERQVERV